MARNALCAALAGLLSMASLHAQFYTGGGDPGRVGWRMEMRGHYQFLFPSGLDSLAGVYAGWLDAYQTASGVSTGMSWLSRPIPVIFHGYSTTSNGLVTWTPKRLELYSQPSVYDPDPLYWPQSLAVHETRHIFQMQAGYTGPFRWLRGFFGEIVPGVVSGLYAGPAMLEGDAVVAETGLTAAGRGRNAEFLEYYHWAFDNGDYRNWYRWRYGSWKFYAPNHYSLGYLTIAGDRVLYDDPLFMSRYLSGIAEHPFRIGNMQNEIAKASGKRFKDAFREIQDSTAAIWRRFDAGRAPFMEAAPVLRPSKWYEEYSSLCDAGDHGLYAIRTGKANAPELVSIVGDSVIRVRSWSASTGRLAYGGGRLWWSESVPGVRWSLAQTSRIRYADLEDGSVRVHSLTTRGRLYNPRPSPDGRFIAAIDYPYDGGSAVVVLSASVGEEVERWVAPDGVDLYEAAWAFGGVVAAGVSVEGEGIYSVPDFKPMVSPCPVAISNLKGGEDALTFASDRSGVNEVYSLGLDGSVRQLTNTRYGTKEFVQSGDTLLYLMESGTGHHVFASCVLDPKEVVVDDISHHVFADRLSEQERSMTELPQSAERRELVSKHYCKAMPRFHSWMPLYVDVNDVSSDSFDDVVSSAKLGATVFFQNTLGDLYGSAAYGYGLDPDVSGDCRHFGHFSLTYTGLYPAFSFEAEIGDRQSLQYRRMIVGGDALGILYTTYQYLDRPLLNGSARVYIPFNFSSGGVYRGVTPSIKYRFSNDLYDRSTVYYSDTYGIAGSSFRPFSGYVKGKNVFMQQLDFTLRAYSMRATAEAAEYPRLGIGTELGYHARLGLADLFSAGIYSYVYCYLPGLTKVQGLRLTALYQHRFTDGVIYGENTVTTIPRGFVTTDVKQLLANNASEQLRLTVDYAIPIWVGDISFLSPLFYIKNFVVKPHADVTMLSFGGTLEDGNLTSVGVDVSAKLANFLWFPYDTSLGVTFDWKGGKSWDLFRNSGAELGDRLYVALVFSMDI